MNVIGMGESKTPNAFISACNSFKYLDILYQSFENEEKEEASTIEANNRSNFNISPKETKKNTENDANDTTTQRKINDVVHPSLQFNQNCNPN